MNTKLSIIYNLLAEHKLTIISEISDDLKCVICNEVLVNAQQSLCGCHFCLVCINNYKNSGSKNCPGNTEECKTENFANTFPDRGTNKRISNLIVRCINEKCCHECRLIEMEDHMRFCSTRNANCPFNNVGCEHEDMNIDKLNDHMLSEIVNHNKILIDIIGNLRNEVRELNEKEEQNRKEIEILKANYFKKDEKLKLLNKEIRLIKKEKEKFANQTDNCNRYHNEIEILKANDSKKDEKLELLMKEINLIKKEKEDLADQMEICDRNLWNSFDKIDKEMKDKCTNDVIKSINDEMKLLKMEEEELSQQIDILKSNFDDKSIVEMNARLNEMKKEWSEKVEIQTIETNKINKYLNMRDDGGLLWQIGKISEIDCMNSGVFYDKQNPYKMRLVLQNQSDEMRIWLYIHSGVFDEDLKWPCRANITIEIFARDEKNIIKQSITKSLTIDKPESEIAPQGSKEEIKFSHSDLIKSKHFNKYCSLFCSVKFD